MEAILDTRSKEDCLRMISFYQEMIRRYNSKVEEFNKKEASPLMTLAAAAAQVSEKEDRRSQSPLQPKRKRAKTVVDDDDSRTDEYTEAGTCTGDCDEEEGVTDMIKARFKPAPHSAKQRKSDEYRRAISDSRRATPIYHVRRIWGQRLRDGNLEYWTEYIGFPESTPAYPVPEWTPADVICKHVNSPKAIAAWEHCAVLF